MTTAIERAPRMELEARQITPLSLIQDALNAKVAPEVLKELVGLQQSMIRFEWEAQERQSKIDFDDALNTCQSQIGRIAPNVHRENNIWWADYPQLDRAVRPLYIAAGFSIGFSEVAGTDSSRLRMCATLSRSGVSREYFAEISRTPASSKMSQTDADASAASRVKRYLLLDIFNISIGIDKDEKKPFPEQAITEQQEAQLLEWGDSLKSCPHLNALKNTFADAYKFAKSISPKAQQDMTKVYEEMKRRLA